ncbi:MAG: hypothetical protein IPF78_04395 [Flavobacteriales bacterium]|nr:hypothetical protein [Flavobacteriales bacterium]
MFRPRTSILSFCFATALTAFAQDDRCTSTLETVAQQVGKTVDFCGTPAQVTVRGKNQEGPVFLNFGAKFPDHTFTVVIWGTVAGAEISELPERFSGKRLVIHGMVVEHNGKPEIILAALKDIEVEEE